MKIKQTKQPSANALTICIFACLYVHRKCAMFAFTAKSAISLATSQHKTTLGAHILTHHTTPHPLYRLWKVASSSSFGHNIPIANYFIMSISLQKSNIFTNFRQCQSVAAAIVRCIGIGLGVGAGKCMCGYE